MDYQVERPKALKSRWFRLLALMVVSALVLSAMSIFTGSQNIGLLRPTMAFADEKIFQLTPEPDAILKGAMPSSSPIVAVETLNSSAGGDFLSHENKKPSPITSPVRTAPFRVLCTSIEKVMRWGSFKIRCRDFKVFSHKYFPDVEIDWGSRPSGDYNATVVVKDLGLGLLSNTSNITYGQLYIDVVDGWHLHNEKIIPKDYQVIVQNRFQAEIFPHRTTHIVTHWSNSFPGDDQEYPPGELPPIQPLASDQPLRMATVWDPRRGENLYLSVNGTTNVQYDHIEEKFAIAEWYLKYAINDTQENIKQIMDDPDLGSGFLYRNLFRQYHALVVYPKQGMKLTYNNVQRVVSQMRSGVPVLVDCSGRSHQDFCEHYEYPCSFTDQASFTNLLERMKSVELRKRCQQQGIEITKDYTPRTIVETFLKALGLDIAKS
jgi:hypothetical protein